MATPYNSMQPWNFGNYLNALSQYGPGPAVTSPAPVLTRSMGTPEVPSVSSDHAAFLESIGISPGSTGFANHVSPSNAAIEQMVGIGESPAAPSNWGQGIMKTLQDWGVIGTKDPKTGQMGDSWGGFALDLGKTGFGIYNGMQQYNLYKDMLNNSKSQFERQFAAQRGLINSQLEDRQRARLASGQAGPSVADYMAKYGVK